jgi:hypothetical protein
MKKVGLKLDLQEHFIICRIWEGMRPRRSGLAEASDWIFVAFLSLFLLFIFAGFVERR